MGEVYRAHDSRLGRDVALKVLPSELSADPERLRRFEQEARATAALNNSFILAVYDIGTDVSSGSPTPYIVSEMLDGETLASRLTAGPLPVRKAVDYAVQIAQGLAAAHEKGIVHRDLKPANLFVTADGRMKILDFGLAKLVEREGAQAGVSVAPTIAPDTMPGVVLGTVGYMSPEQVRGKPADHRSDIFALGVVLYEMLSGRRAFRGETTADTMTAILKEDPPDLPVAERHIPPALARIVDRCLQKNPASRFQSAGDLAFALDAVSSPSDAHTASPHAEPVGRARGGLWWTIATLTLTAAIAALATAAFFSFTRRLPEQPRTMRLSIALAEGWQLSLPALQGTSTTLVISPDGRRLAMVARRADGRNTILIRPLDSITAQPLPGTEGVSSMFWSPDSRSLGFIADNKLKKIDVTGGPPTTLCDAQSPGGGGTWSRNGTIVFSTLDPNRNGFTLK
jgi:serine/threonine protein kinase